MNFIRITNHLRVRVVYSFDLLSPICLASSSPPKSSHHPASIQSRSSSDQIISHIIFLSSTPTRSHQINRSSIVMSFCFHRFPGIFFTSYSCYHPASSQSCVQSGTLSNLFSSFSLHFGTAQKTTPQPLPQVSHPIFLHPFPGIYFPS